MTAKEYLSQMRPLQSGIESKLEQVQSLQALATKANAVLSHIPSGPTRNVHNMEDIIVQMVDLKDEIFSEVERLVELRKSIASTIEQVSNPTYRRILEMRYLCCKPWDDIAGELKYEPKYVFRLHGRALQEIDTKRE